MLFGSASETPRDTFAAEKSKPKRRKSYPKYRSSDVLELFSATEESYKNGQLTLFYKFESREDSLTNDWLPEISEKTYKKVRWSRGVEGTLNSIEHGIIVLNKGIWHHKGRFLPTSVEIEAEIMFINNYRKGMFLATGFYQPRRICALRGTAASSCSRSRGSRTGEDPHPAKYVPLKAYARPTISTRLMGSRGETRFGNKKMADSKDAPKFLKGFEGPCHPTLIWSGNVLAYVFGVSVKGKLDPEWLQEKIGDPEPEKPKKKKKKKRSDDDDE